MQQRQFFELLQSLESLTSEQVSILRSALPISDDANPGYGSSTLLEAVVENFQKSPYCPRCNSEHVGGWGIQSGYQRYKCHDCKRTFNALTCTSLARLHVPEKLDEYIDCMKGHTTLREAAAQCDVSLPTSFRLRHRLMDVIQSDKAELLTDITEIDETFFLENHKGKRDLGADARKRGKRSLRGKKRQSKAEQKPIKKIPVMVACDRQNHVTDAVLEHVSADELEAELNGRIQPGSILCADAYLSHESIARRLKLTLKELVSKAGIYVLDTIYHIQHVNAYHSDLKAWINGFFRGVATKNLYKYLGWKRYLKTEEFSKMGFLERIASHWVRPLLN